MKKIAVMGSGNGTNFRAIAKFFRNYPVKILCISDKENAKILEIAKELNIEYKYVPFKGTEHFFSKNSFDLIILAGYMRILPPEVLKLGKFINIHPSLLPSFKGKNAIEQAYNAKVKVTGVTIHFVNEEVDSGEIIAQYPLFIEQNDCLSTITEKMHEIEHKIYPIVIKALLENKSINLI